MVKLNALRCAYSLQEKLLPPIALIALTKSPTPSEIRFIPNIGDAPVIKKVPATICNTARPPTTAALFHLIGYFYCNKMTESIPSFLA